MPGLTISPDAPAQEAERPVHELYRRLLEAWNAQDATAFAAGFAGDGCCVGFDGSTMVGPSENESALGGVFSDHETADYVALVREVRLVEPDTALLRAEVGMVPPGETDLSPDRNAIQSVVAHREDDRWRIELFQNTPARFDGRPEVAEALTQELRELL